MATNVVLRNVAKRRGAAPAVHGADLHDEPGECAILIGPSGWGKSAPPRMIAGLWAISDGDPPRHLCESDGAAR